MTISSLPDLTWKNVDWMRVYAYLKAHRILLANAVNNKVGDTTYYERVEVDDLLKKLEFMFRDDETPDQQEVLP